ncbi:putative uncharacterized protein BRD3OS isoform X2 [Cebus imitator]|uniref:putative uncharacterized protein BRD3OS isoform X2 n=1 Tax=Cebus imitator TaxID=2715852 RepID=UPI00189AAE12|nr:putative uncharacterized protein BRD3OS isoform X2 [Cebus imitator]
MARARRTRLPRFCARLARPAALPWRHCPRPQAPPREPRGASRELDARSRKAAPAGPGAGAWRRLREPAPFQAPLAPVSQTETLKPQQAAAPIPPRDRKLALRARLALRAAPRLRHGSTTRERRDLNRRWGRIPHVGRNSRRPEAGPDGCGCVPGMPPERLPPCPFLSVLDPFLQAQWSRPWWQNHPPGCDASPLSLPHSCTRKSCGQAPL